MIREIGTGDRSLGFLGECDRWTVGWVKARNPIFAWVTLSLTTTTNKLPYSAIAHRLS
ncbi:MAG: hypothetical protein V7L26_20460 [Nostoc sp.]|uniref:hypothetical protein n=1 Tax=Nostoc sp. TaxID=1180 RepID=UPI002FF5AA6B